MYSTEFLDLPPLGQAHGTVTLPGSKSISNRVLLLAALCQGTTTVHDLLDSDDTRVMLDALRVLGCGIRQDGARVEIDGLDGKLTAHSAKLFLGNAGPAMPPPTPALAGPGVDRGLRAPGEAGVRAWGKTREGLEAATDRFIDGHEDRARALFRRFWDVVRSAA